MTDRPYGDEYVRFSLIENEQRIRQATRGIRTALGAGSGVAVPADAADAERAQDAAGDPTKQKAVT